MNLLDETVLLKNVENGDEASFREVYDYYSIYVYRTAYHYLKSVELAEDGVQEIFLALWCRRERLGQVESFKSYLFAMTRNFCLKQLKEKVHLISLHNEFSEIIEGEYDDGWEERHLLLMRAVNDLPPQQKKIFEMAKIDGLSHDTISRELNLSPSTVNNHITAAVRSVRNHIRQSIVSIVVFLWHML